DEREIGTQGEGGHDVRAVHDSGVEDDLDVATHLAGNLGQEVERHGGPVELAAAVDRQHDAVDTEVGELLRILEGLHAFDGDPSRPLFADLLQILEVDCRIHRGVEKFADGPTGVRQGCELEFRRGEEVEPPPGPGDRVRDRAQRYLRRDGEAV